MKWTKFTLETTTEAVDLVSDMLNDLGIVGIEVSDNIPITEEEKKRLFIDILPELKDDDGSAIVSFYVDADEDTKELIANVKEGLKELSEYVVVGSGKLNVTETEDKDWINNWKEFFKPFRIDDTIVIKPTWEELTDQKEEDLVIEIDPGTSFGTGAHETTKLCIIGIKQHIKPDSIILDAGSGSGILSIIAKKLGAKEVLGIDIDSNATNSAIENAAVNELPIEEGTLSFVTGNIIEDDGIRTQIGKEKYDMVVANILADVIIPLSDVIGENLKPGGIFISSGIINMKENAVREAIEKNHFTILEVNKMGDWVSFVAKK
ncbi:MAG: 50S ribosomal protein L11 methyltransferase [Herbinix sp.]|nr:50S ribosomal protein L11 methyltransferase [Herbinix sp.]